MITPTTSLALKAQFRQFTHWTTLINESRHLSQLGSNCFSVQKEGDSAKQTAAYAADVRSWVSQLVTKTQTNSLDAHVASYIVALDPHVPPFQIWIYHLHVFPHFIYIKYSNIHGFATFWTLGGKPQARLPKQCLVASFYTNPSVKSNPSSLIIYLDILLSFFYCWIASFLKKLQIFSFIICLFVISLKLFI